MRHRVYVYATLGVGLFLGILPTVIMYAAHGLYPRLPLEIVDDTLYYYARIREVLAGHYFIGNPYLLEHVSSVTTAFFVGDWFYAVPFYILSLFRAPLSAGIIVSQVLWSVCTAWLLSMLFARLRVLERYIPWAVAFSMLSVLIFIWRPVAMAVVFPCFIFFLISLHDWLLNPKGTRETMLIVLSSAVSFYAYTYLWQVVLVALGFLLLFVMARKADRVRTFFMLCAVGLLSVPVFIYTWTQLHSQFYFETLHRVGLVSTHMVGSAALVYSAVIFVSLYILYLCRRAGISENHHTALFGIVFLSLLVTGLSNVFSGRDLEVAVHIGRFTELFAGIFLIYIISAQYASGRPAGKQMAILFIFMLVYVGHLIYANVGVVSRALSDNRDAEAYVSVMQALNDAPPSAVVFADDAISSYVPVVTGDYVVFHPNAQLYLMSDREAEDRYLVSRMFDGLTKDELKADFRMYAGVGNAVHQANVINRSSRLCRFAEKVFSRISCPSTVTPYSLKGEEYFDGLMDRYAYIVAHKEEFLDMYHVQYIAVDGSMDRWDMSGLSAFRPYRSNSRFVILKRE